MPLKTFNTAIVDYFNKEFRKYPCSSLLESGIVDEIYYYGKSSLIKENKFYFSLMNWFTHAPNGLKLTHSRLQTEINLTSNNVKTQCIDILLVENEKNYKNPNSHNDSQWENWLYKCTIPFEVKYHYIKNNKSFQTMIRLLNTDFDKWNGLFHYGNFSIGFCAFFGTSIVPKPYTNISEEDFIKSKGGKFLFACDVDPLTGETKKNQIYQL